CLSTSSTRHTSWPRDWSSDVCSSDLDAEGKGFYQMMERLPYERLGVAVVAVATAEQAVAVTTDYVKQRTAFGKPLIELQNTRFKIGRASCRERLTTSVHVVLVTEYGD